MKANLLKLIMLIAAISFTSCSNRDVPDETLILRDNWAIISSANVTEDGSAISTPSWQPANWYPATVPSTVLGTLVTNKVYPDPYFGTNIESIPGYFSRRGAEIPDDSPFKPSWWYRTVFTIPSDFKGMNTWLKLHSINYQANIWINGQLVADTTEIEGAYRLYNLNITDQAVPGKENCLAIQIFPPEKTDLTITWVDWNPTPPDKATGIWYDVKVTPTGPVAIESPRVITKLNLPSTDTARLTVITELKNTTDKRVKGVITGKIENITFSQDVTLEPSETKKVEISPLTLPEPRLWWPHTAGPQNLYDLDLQVGVKGGISDRETIRFGIREITSWMNEFDGKHTRVFQVNGKNIVIKGGGYVEDLLLRPSNDRVDTDIAYAKHMGLNALRLEAPRGSDYFFEKCDEEGIMLIVGWCCCSSWERWRKWTPHVQDIAGLSWRDQIVRLRNHPSVFNWLYGSDMFPPENVERMYIDTLNAYDGTRPYQSSATADSSNIDGNTGLYMGPFPVVYSYRPPSYWYGKLEFNTEAGPSGEQIPPLETMRKMMPEQDLWPMSASWDIRLHRNFFPDARNALYSRYGKPEDLEEYSTRSQVLQYEATRAMFEAYAGNKYRSSGIIYWMYNSAWPKMYWQFYDYFFAPNGSFYGARKATENLHIQYSYGDGSVMVVNSTYADQTGLTAYAKLYNSAMELKYSGEARLDVKPDESAKVDMPGLPRSAGDVYFLKLELKDNNGELVSSNFYWLSARGDEKADFRSLIRLAEVEPVLSISSVDRSEGQVTAVIELENTSPYLAFSVNPKILKSGTEDLVLPVFWEDNYFSLLPGEKRSVSVTFSEKDLSGSQPVLVLDGWNIRRSEKELR